MKKEILTLYRESDENTPERNLYHFQGNMTDKIISKIKVLPGVENVFHQDRYHIIIYKGIAYSWDDIEWQLKRICSDIVDLNTTKDFQESTYTYTIRKKKRNFCTETKSFKCHADSYMNQACCKHFKYCGIEKDGGGIIIICDHGHPGGICHSEEARKNKTDSF